LEKAQADLERVRSGIQSLQKRAEEKQLAINNHQRKLNDLKDRKNSLSAEILEVGFELDI